MAKPIKTTPRKKWHRPEDKWQVRFQAGCNDFSFLVAYPEKPGVLQLPSGPVWRFGLYNGKGTPNAYCATSPSRHAKKISPAASMASLRRIV